MNFTRRDVLKAAGTVPFASLLAPTTSSVASTRPRSALKVRDFTTIQAALDAALPGDVVEIPAGTYHEAITFHRSGDVDAPITLTAAPGATVIIDGADAELQMPGSDRWNKVSGDTYLAVVPFDSATPANAIGTWISRYGVQGTNQCDRLIAAYSSLETLEGNAPRGEGSYRTGESGDQVYVRLEDAADPNAIGLNVGRSHAVLNLSGQSHLRIKNLEIRNGGWAGIWTPPPIAGAHGDIVLENVTVKNCFWGIAGRGISGLTIRRVRILNGKVPNWVRVGGYVAGVGAYPSSTNNDALSPWRGFGVRYGESQGVEVTDCIISGQWDGLKFAACQNVKIHHNTIRSIWDDAVELESSSNIQREIEVFNNHVYDTNVAFSVTPNGPGPVYVYRNVAECEHARDGSRYNIKSGDDNVGMAENVKFYHNTFHSGGRAGVMEGEFNVWEKLSDGAPNRWHRYEFVNNIFHRTREESLAKPNWNFRGGAPGIPGDDNHWEANVYNVSTPEDQLGHDWDDSKLANANAPWQAHDLDNIPEHVQLVGSFDVPAIGGAGTGSEYSVSTAALAQHIDELRIRGMRSVTFILREAKRQPNAIHFSSKEGSLPATSLHVGMQDNHQLSLDAPVADTYVINLNANDSHGGEEILSVLNGSSSTTQQLGYIRFNLGDMLPKPVDSAILTMRLASLGPDRTASTVQVYALSPDFTPAPGAEPNALILPDLAEQFMNFDVDCPTTPRDLRLTDTSAAKNSGSDYPTRQGWPDSVQSYPGGRNRGAWEDGMGPNEIGARYNMLRLLGRTR
jgi:hypothetical protein